MERRELVISPIFRPYFHLYFDTQPVMIRAGKQPSFLVQILGTIGFEVCRRTVQGSATQSSSSRTGDGSNTGPPVEQEFIHTLYRPNINRTHYDTKPLSTTNFRTPPLPLTAAHTYDCTLHKQLSSHCAGLLLWLLAAVLFPPLLLLLLLCESLLYDVVSRRVREVTNAGERERSFDHGGGHSLQVGRSDAVHLLSELLGCGVLAVRHDLAADVLQSHCSALQLHVNGRLELILGALQLLVANGARHADQFLHQHVNQVLRLVRHSWKQPTVDRNQ